MVSAMDSGLKCPGSSPDRGHCVVFSGKTLYSHSASLHPGSRINEYQQTVREKLRKCWKVTCDGLASHPGGVAILLVASCYRNQDKLRRYAPLGSYARLL